MLRYFKYIIVVAAFFTQLLSWHPKLCVLTQFIPLMCVCVCVLLWQVVGREDMGKVVRMQLALIQPGGVIKIHKDMGGYAKVGAPIKCLGQGLRDDSPGAHEGPSLDGVNVAVADGQL